MKNFNEFTQDIQELRAVSALTRRKIGRRMKRLAKTSAFKQKKQRAMLKIASPEKQKIKANKMAKKIIIQRFYPKYDEFGPMQRAKIDLQIKQKYGTMIDKLAKKFLLRVKKGEIEKVKKARASKQDKGNK